MEWVKSAEAMWKQIFQIQRYDPVNWKLKYSHYKHYWKHGCFLFNFENFLRTPPVAASLKNEQGM